MDVFKPLIESGKQVLSFHLSRALSSTVDSARLAAQQVLAPDRIHAVDTCSMSYGIAVPGDRGGTSRHGRTSQPAILERIDRLKNRSDVLFSLNALDYLHKLAAG